MFWNGHEFDHWRREYEQRRASLQPCGSRHAHENIQAIGRKETGRFEMMLHQRYKADTPRLDFGEEADTR